VGFYAQFGQLKTPLKNKQQLFQFKVFKTHCLALQVKTKEDLVYQNVISGF